MSAGKRLAKRSIVGTRICAPLGETGQYNPGVIIGSKNPDELFFNNCHTGITSNSKYVVRFEAGDTREFSESELVGPGFGSVNSLKLRSGQKVFVTHNGREVSGTVVYHTPKIDEVLISIPPSPGSNEISFDVTKKLEDVRLLESRKSARLQEQDFDFARLADVADRKRSQQTASIDVPKNNIMSRKRRPSSGNLFQPVANLGGDEDVMDECSAAMVLMSLSCSPHSTQWDNNVGMISSSWSSSSSGASSWLSANKSVASSFGAVSSPGELHLNNCSPTPSSSDDGVESDIGDCWEEPRRKRTRQIFKCTFPGCTMEKERCFEIEAHVRYAHLGGKQNSPDDHEEEFYYAEIEVPDLSSSPASFGGSTVGLSMAFSPTLSHMDMVRPPCEDPEYKLSQQQQASQQHQQLQRKSPNTNTHLNPKKRASPKSSPVRRPRGDTKKCRKVYGMERKDMWCTQCKWKKACTRFGD